MGLFDVFKGPHVQLNVIIGDWEEFCDFMSDCILGAKIHKTSTEINELEK